MSATLRATLEEHEEVKVQVVQVSASSLRPHTLRGGAGIKGDDAALSIFVLVKQVTCVGKPGTGQKREDAALSCCAARAVTIPTAPGFT